MKLVLSQSLSSFCLNIFGLLWLFPILVIAIPFPSARVRLNAPRTVDLQGSLGVWGFLSFGTTTTKRQQPGEALICNFQNQCGSIRPPYGRSLCVDFGSELLASASGEVDSGSNGLSETGTETNATDGSWNNFNDGEVQDIVDEVEDVDENETKAIESSKNGPSENGRYAFLERQTKNMTMSYVACVTYENQHCSGESLGADYSLSWTPKVIDFENWNGNNVSTRIISIDCMFL